MPNETRFKIAFIGSHGVGKTSLCYGLAARLKRKDVALDVVHEVARRCPLPINQDTNVAAQTWILHTQVAEELLAHARYPVVICDRSILDNYVYLLLAAGSQPGLEPLLDYWMTTYDLLVHVPIFAAPSADGVRAVDPTFQRAVEERLQVEVSRRGLSTLQLDPNAPQEWIDRVEDVVGGTLEPPQLSLV